MSLFVVRRLEQRPCRRAVRAAPRVTYEEQLENERDVAMVGIRSSARASTARTMRWWRFK